MQSLSSEQQQWISRHFDMKNSQALCGDAGFRRYFRILIENGSLIFMDASEEPITYHAFIQQSKNLHQHTFPIPKLLAHDNDQHWALMEDFGDELLFETLQSTENPLQVADEFYHQALDHLLMLNQLPINAFGRLSILDESVMMEDLLGWQEWCLEGLFQQIAPASLLSCYQKIIDEVMRQPYVFMHRDFHCKNLLRKPDGSLGIIDYQDAMAGPMTYDLASLLRDCYIDWPETNVKRWVLYYKKEAQKLNLLDDTISDQLFLTWFDWTSIQRHLKALFTFSRKSLRDHNDNYLQFVPRTLNYIDEISSRYKALSELTKIIKNLREKT